MAANEQYFPHKRKGIARYGKTNIKKEKTTT